MRPLGRIVGVLAVFALLGAACTSHIRGAAIPPSPPPTSAPPSSAPSSPSSSPEPSGSAGTAAPEVPVRQAVMESHRMGVHVVDPSDELDGVSEDCFPGGPYPTPQNTAAIVLGTDTEKFLARAGYVGGWFQCFKDGGKNGLGGVVGLMEAYDEAHAAQLVTDLGLSGIHPGSKSIDLPGLPDATVVRYPNYDKQPVIWAFQRTGRVISYAYTDVKKGGDPALPSIRDTVTTLLKAQIAQTERFEPTPAAELPTLDDDPQLLDGKLATPAGEPDFWTGGYSAETYPAIANDADKELPLLRQNGFTQMYRKESDGDAGYRIAMIFALRDHKAAVNVYTGRVRQITAGTPKSPELPAPKLEHVYCDVADAGSTKGQSCVFVAGRYLLQLAIFNGPSKGGRMAAMFGMIHKQLALTPE